MNTPPTERTRTRTRTRARALARARSHVLEMSSTELVDRLDHLDRVRHERLEAPPAAPPPPPPSPERGTRTDFDVVIAGGGLWSVLAPLLAARGLRVAVVERGRAGVAHREWNASGPELRALVTCGLVSEEELARLIVARYRTGTCRFHGGGSYPVDSVLDHAVDAGPLLAHARALAESRGVVFLDRHEVVAQSSGHDAVAIHARTAEGRDRMIIANVLVDARGAASPFASGDLVCPTVGGVVRGIAQGDGPQEINPEVGEILATIDPIDQDTQRQHVWEAFPGRADETTVYLFYYARAEEPVSLLELYARFFATLPNYKRGENNNNDAMRVIRPTFGFIPGWSRLSPAPAATPRHDSRIVLVGDAAARQSPLTYCGFGATLRSLGSATELIVRAVGEPDRPVPTHAMHDPAIHAVTGALAHMLASRTFAGDELNRLLDASFASLHAMGNEPYAKLLRDELEPREMIAFLRKTAQLHPDVWGQVWRGLGARRLGHWSVSFARSLMASSSPPPVVEARSAFVG